jgi:hypothetical protein
MELDHPLARQGIGESLTRMGREQQVRLTKDISGFTKLIQETS